MSRELAPEIARYSKDPWAFLTDCCFTRDQVDLKFPVKAFPRDWEYLHYYVRMWEQHPRMAVPKSRRMFMSWCNIGLYLWAALFSEGQDFAFVSKKEDDAAELVKRAEFIYDNIPSSKIPRAVLPRKETKAKPAALIFPDINSKIQGFPMGADQLRSYTFSGILGDECAFWEDAQKFYSASVSTTEGGGRMTLVSSRHPGFFQRLVYDRLDDEDAIDETKTPVKLYPFKDDSVVVWQNPGNRFLVFNLHYTANPNKRSPGWREAVRKSMPRKDFMVEYETEWNVYDGRPVFEDYSPARHETKTPIEPYLGLPLLVGWDFGLTPAAIVAQLRDNTLFILREFTAQNKSIDRFAPHVMQQLRQYYPEWADSSRDFRHYIDPAGLQEAQTDQRTCAGVMAAAGLRNISPGFPNNTWEPRRKAVERFLLQHTKDGAGLQLYPAHCPMLAKGFAGGYRYPDKYAHIEPKKPEPVKDQYSHCFQAGTMVSTPSGKRPIETICPGDLVTAPGGTFRVTATMGRRNAATIRIKTKAGRILCCTPDHPIWSSNSFVRADTLQYGSELCLDPQSIQSRNSTALGSTANRLATIRQIISLAVTTCTGMSGRSCTEISQPKNIFITSTRIKQIIASRTWRLWTKPSTAVSTVKRVLRQIRQQLRSELRLRKSMQRFGIALGQAASGIENMLSAWLSPPHLSLITVSNAERVIRLSAEHVSVDSVGRIVSSKRAESLASTTRKESARYAQGLSLLSSTLGRDAVAEVVHVSSVTDVYDLTVGEAHCFFANDILVSNCADALQYLCGGACSLLSTRPSVDIPVPYYAFQKNEQQQAAEDYASGRNEYGIVSGVTTGGRSGS